MNKSYYAIIPADVRYSDIPHGAKLLYGEITALSNEKGYCWASNRYFADLYKVSDRTIRLWLEALESKGFIKKEFRGKDENTQRHIYIGAEKNFLPPRTKISEGAEKNFHHNNTRNNTSNIKQTDKKSKNKFLDFDQRDYDMNLLEQKLINRR